VDPLWPRLPSQQRDQRAVPAVGGLAAALALAVVLFACSANLAASVPSASAPRANTTPTPAATSVPASSSVGPSVTSIAACSAESLVAAGGRQGEGGVAHGDVAFTNTGHTPCSLSDAPAAVALLRADGTPLPLKLQAPTEAAGPTVVLDPGVDHAAWLVVYWMNWCGAAPGPLRIRIVLGGGSGTVVAPFDGPPNGDYVARCDLPGQPSTLQSDVFGAGR